jgi:hypothetical protein
MVFYLCKTSLLGNIILKQKNNKNAYLTQESVGQTEAHWGSSKWPLHSTQSLGSIT